MDDPIFDHIARHRAAASALSSACDDLCAISDGEGGRELAVTAYAEQLAITEFSVLKEFEAAVPTTLEGLLAKLVYAAEICRRDPETSGLYDVAVLLNSLADAAGMLQSGLQ